jgi:hypothetical protein
MAKNRSCGHSGQSKKTEADKVSQAKKTMPSASSKKK